MPSSVTVLSFGAPFDTSSPTAKNWWSTARLFGMTMAAWTDGVGFTAPPASMSGGAVPPPSGRSRGMSSMGMVGPGPQRGGRPCVSGGMEYGDSLGSGWASCVIRLMITGYSICTVWLFTRKEKVYSKTS